MRYLSTVLLTTSITTALAQPSHQDLLYSADITTGKVRLFGGVTLGGDFRRVDKAPKSVVPVWQVDAGKLMSVRFRLPIAIEHCRLKVRELGMPRREGVETTSILFMNDNRIQRLQVAKPHEPQTRFYNLAQHLQVGDNVLKIGGLDHDLGLQSLVIQCTAPLPVAATATPTETAPRITLLAPVAGQAISADKPLDIAWATDNLPDSARFDIDYLAKNGQWQPVDKGIPHNHPTQMGQRGFYRWAQLPADVDPQLQVRLRYDTEQPAAGSRWTEPTTGIAFVYVPPGCFQIGSPKTEVGHQPDETPTRLCVEGFWMGKTEVTNAQYKYKQNHDSGEGFNQDNQPVVKLNRSQAHQFAQWLSQPTGNTFRLPTEAEWEYSARAGKTTAYAWGNDSRAACQHANIADITWRTHTKASTSETCKDHHAVTAPVAQFPANDFGLHDMSGNVSEWTCSTMPFDNRYTGANTCQMTGFMPTPSIRGSNFAQWGNTIRLAKRFWGLGNPQQVGFRLVRVLASQP
ncbi:MAG: hypothetical protein DRR19_32785, partial [Candidatus Parabeggiatoa sp. nov. 1]